LARAASERSDRRRGRMSEECQGTGEVKGVS
jgi:hypothetical protein